MAVIHAPWSHTDGGENGMTHAHDHEHGHQHGQSGEPGEEFPTGMFTQEYWDNRYRTKPALWSGQPNSSLVSEASGLTPGTALEVGAGEGADAIWLARQGWTVTAVDVSAVALERAAGHAADAGPEVTERIRWERRDMLEWQVPQRSFDLVTAHYIHVPSGMRPELYRRLAGAVAPGGMLLVAAHHPSDLQTSVSRPQFPDLFFTGDDLAADLGADEWEVVTNAAPSREVKDADGNMVTIRDTVFRARRVG